MAIINIPFLYNPELGKITFELMGKPTMGPISAIRAYVFVGLLPLIFGLIFVLFSVLTSRKIELLLYKNGMCRYVKKGTSNFKLDALVDFQIKDSLQQIEIGKRHQRFVIWATVGLFAFIIFMLYDYLNFLNLAFDIEYEFYDYTLSLRTVLLVNIFWITGVLLLITLFPRKLCRIDTANEFVQFDYCCFTVEKNPKLEGFSLPYIAPFNKACSCERKEGLVVEKKESNAENLPAALKAQLGSPSFRHFPLITLVFNVAFFIVIQIPLLVPNFFLGGFTFRIEYFLSVATYYFLLFTLQNLWFNGQVLELTDNNSNLLIKRNNRLFGDKVQYYYNIDKIEQDFAPRKPHYLEFVLMFFPLWQMIWVIDNMINYSNYFLTTNEYTWIYILVIVGVFGLSAAEYIFPNAIISILPKSQSQNLKRAKSERYQLYFPSDQLLKVPPLKEAFKQKKLFKGSVSGMLLILVPVVFGVIWVVLSTLGVVIPVYDTIF